MLELDVGPDPCDDLDVDVDLSSDMMARKCAELDLAGLALRSPRQLPPPSPMPPRAPNPEPFQGSRHGAEEGPDAARGRCMQSAMGWFHDDLDVDMEEMSAIGSEGRRQCELEPPAAALDRASSPMPLCTSPALSAAEADLDLEAVLDAELLTPEHGAAAPSPRHRAPSMLPARAPNPEPWLPHGFCEPEAAQEAELDLEAILGPELLSPEHGTAPQQGHRSASPLPARAPNPEPWLPSDWCEPPPLSAGTLQAQSPRGLLPDACVQLRPQTDLIEPLMEAMSLREQRAMCLKQKIDEVQQRISQDEEAARALEAAVGARQLDAERLEGELRRHRELLAEAELRAAALQESELPRHRELAAEAEMRSMVLQESELQRHRELVAEAEMRSMVLQAGQVAGAKVGEHAQLALHERLKTTSPSELSTTAGDLSSASFTASSAGAAWCRALSGAC